MARRVARTPRPYLTPTAEASEAEVHEARLAGVRLWVRPDGRPKAIQAGTTRPYGQCVLVRGSTTADEARRCHDAAATLAGLKPAQRAELGRVRVAQLEELADRVVVEADWSAPAAPRAAERGA